MFASCRRLMRNRVGSLRASRLGSAQSDQGSEERSRHGYLIRRIDPMVRLGLLPCRSRPRDRNQYFLAAQRELCPAVLGGAWFQALGQQLMAQVCLVGGDG